MAIVAKKRSATKGKKEVEEVKVEPEAAVEVEVPVAKKARKAKPVEEKSAVQVIEEGAKKTFHDQKQEKKVMTPEHYEKISKFKYESSMVVNQMRKDGKNEDQIKIAKNEIRDRFGLPSVEQSVKNKETFIKNWKSGQRSNDKEKAKKMKKRHDCIFMSSLEVKFKALAVMHGLGEQDFDFWADTRGGDTMEAKALHWHKIGSLLTVEMSDEDLVKGVCQVSKATAVDPEAPRDKRVFTVEKVEVPIPPAGKDQLMKQLLAFGLEKRIVEDSQQSQKFSKTEKSAVGEEAKKAEEPKEESEASEAEEEVEAPVAKKTKKVIKKGKKA